MTQPTCEPVFGIVPGPCTPGGGGGPGDACCSPSIATTTLCQPGDCTPISLVVRSGCAACSAGPGAPELVGWLDAAGTLTTGSPPAGLVSCGNCAEPCETVARCPGLAGLSDGEVWTPPAGVESVNVNVICPPVIVTPCTGDTAVTIRECGSMAWSAPGEPCTPGELCPSFTVEIPPGSAAYIAYVTTECGG